ncbi:hypothetical protein DPMN_106940 [Dreissena polymorpha]|uniref:Uncharacterized protein n=1 Tax=Dreissena polymorpha TaxID=45954 RepID=A0A9D4K5Y3_DREPO|nr:hypothetical protein DPMN_106940 [Dreissena polymorpha]
MDNAVTDENPGRSVGTGGQHGRLAKCEPYMCMLYTTGKGKYKNKAKDTDVWNSNAAELNLESGPKSKTRYEGIRTVRQEERLGNKRHG